jgi:hypothetical protein
MLRDAEKSHHQTDRNNRPDADLAASRKPAFTHHAVQQDRGAVPGAAGDLGRGRP